MRRHLFIYLHVYGGRRRARGRERERPEDNLQVLVLSYLYVLGMELWLSGLAAGHTEPSCQTPRLFFLGINCSLLSRHSLLSRKLCSPCIPMGCWGEARHQEIAKVPLLVTSLVQILPQEHSGVLQGSWMVTLTSGQEIAQMSG